MEAKQSGNDGMVGAKLRQAREGRGLSVNDVAQALRLSARIITALEDEAYDSLPGPTYVRGYLRNYAQYLGLSGQPLVDAYNRLPEAAQRTEMAAPAPVRQVTSSDILVRLGTVAVAVIVFGLAALWWSGHDAREIAPTALTKTETQAPTNPTTVAPPESEPVKQEPGVAEQDQAAAPASSETTAPTSEEAKSPVATAAPSTERQPETVTAAAAPPAPAPNPDVPLARLVLYVHDDSWADVRDAQQRRLLYETIPAGRVVTVEGVAPLSVFLGNVDGVTVEFNGEVYDATRHKRGQVARFTLGSPPG